MVLLLASTFITLLPPSIKHNRQQERRKPPGLNPAAYTLLLLR
jgi:hypothetical protein